MQPAATPPNARSVAFLRGLIFGLAQTVIAACILLLNTFVNTNTSLALILVVVNFLLSLAAYFGAGALAASKTGRQSTGTFAGLWAGIFYGVLNFIVSLIIFLQVVFPRALALLNSSPELANNPDAVRLGVIVGGIGIELLGSLLAIGLGAGVGALGGLAGRNRSPFAQTSAAPVYSPPPIYSDQPSAPPAPPAPPSSPDQPGDQPYIERPH